VGAQVADSTCGWKIFQLDTLGEHVISIIHPVPKFMLFIMNR
jgi:hypothetical protein